LYARFLKYRTANRQGQLESKSDIKIA
jgi:hypothetical protein